MPFRAQRRFALISVAWIQCCGARHARAGDWRLKASIFFTGILCFEGHTQICAIRNQHTKINKKRNNALWFAWNSSGIKVTQSIDVIEEYKDVLLNPKHGYGRQYESLSWLLKSLWSEKAVEWVNNINKCKFWFHHHWWGKRSTAKSQLKRTMPIVAAESGARWSLLLRPFMCQKSAINQSGAGGLDRSQISFMVFHGRNRNHKLPWQNQFGFWNDFWPR